MFDSALIFQIAQTIVWFILKEQTVNLENFDQYPTLIIIAQFLTVVIQTLFLLASWLFVFKYWQTAYELKFLFRLE
jgi:hypothetical protein